MKWKEIKKDIEEKKLLLIEFTEIYEDNYDSVKNISDFINFSMINHDAIGYIVKEYTSEEATDLNVESIYGSLNTKFADWLEEKHDDEIRRLAKTPECEMITLLNISNNIIWKQNNIMTEEKFNKVMSIIETYKEKYIKELSELLDRQTEEINSLIESYKSKYKEATLLKDKDAIIRKLSAELSIKYNIDGRADPQYRKEALKERLEK